MPDDENLDTSLDTSTMTAFEFSVYRCRYGHEFRAPCLYVLVASDGREVRPCMDCLVDWFKKQDFPELKKVEKS